MSPIPMTEIAFVSGKHPAVGFGRVAPTEVKFLPTAVVTPSAAVPPKDGCPEDITGTDELFVGAGGEPRLNGAHADDIGVFIDAGEVVIVEGREIQAGRPGNRGEAP